MNSTEALKNIDNHLQALLLAQALAGTNIVVLTKKPLNWLTQPKVRAIDISFLISAPYTHSDRSFPELLRVMPYKLESIGWDFDAIYSECTYEDEQGFLGVSDFVIKDERGKWLVSIEVRASEVSEDEILERGRKPDITPAIWSCLTDGTTFIGVNRQNQLGFASFDRNGRWPTPEDFGLKSSQSSKRICAPFSFGELQLLISEMSPTSVIFDLSLADFDPFHDCATPFELLPRDYHYPLNPCETIQDALVLSLTEWQSVRSITFPVLPKHAGAEKYKGFREFVHRNFSIESIIEIAPQVLRTETLILLNAKRSESASFQCFVDLIDSYSDLLSDRSLLELKSQLDIKNRKNIQVGPEGWDMRLYDPELTRIQERIQRLCDDHVKLGDIADVYKASVQRDTGLAADHFIEFKDIKSTDIVVTREFGTRTVFQTMSSFVKNIDERNGLAVIRLKDPRVTTEYIVEFLNSGASRALLVAKSKKIETGVWLSRPALRSLMIPLLGADIMESFGRFLAIDEDLGSKLQAYRTRRQDLFAATDPRKFSDSLQLLIQEARSISASINYSDNFLFRVSNFYPFPIAYTYRKTQNLNNSSEKYQLQFRLLENLLSYVGSICLALLPISSFKNGRPDIIQLWRAGAGEGKWRTVIAICVQVFGQHASNPLVSQIRQLGIHNSAKGLGAIIEALIKARNFYHHGKGPQAEEAIARACEQTASHLELCIKEFGFLAEFPVRLVKDLQCTRNGQEFTLTCLSLIGDHPSLPQADFPFSNPLRKGDLYIQMHQERWLNLHPFLKALHCPTCDCTEIFFVDKWDDDTLTYKSFANGHVVTMQDDGELKARVPEKKD